MTTKFCADCKWVRISFFARVFGDYTEARCGRPSLLDPVSGHPQTFCRHERSPYNNGSMACGPEGTMYEEVGL